jgi:hypothetical protein
LLNGFDARDAVTRPRAEQNFNDQRKDDAMSRPLLKFRVQGGLEKISQLYDRLDETPDAIQACWDRPQALLEGLVDEVSPDIALSDGYRRLADAMSSLDLSAWCSTFPHADIDELKPVDAGAVADLHERITGDELFAGISDDDFNKASITMIMVMMVTVTVTVTVTSGTAIEQPGIKPGVPGPGLRAAQLAQLSAHAQIVADGLGRYARH